MSEKLKPREGPEETVERWGKSELKNAGWNPDSDHPVVTAWWHNVRVFGINGVQPPPENPKKGK